MLQKASVLSHQCIMGAVRGAEGFSALLSYTAELDKIRILELTLSQFEFMNFEL